MKQKKKVEVVFFCRKPLPLGNFSIEIYFDLVRKFLAAPYVPVCKEMPFYNTGLFNRIGNSIYCMLHQGDINHITGDIHYVTSFLKKRKTILTVLDCGMLHQIKGLKQKVFKLFWYTIPNKRTQKFTAISEATKKDVIQFANCNPNKVDVIYVSINEMFKPHPKTFNAAQPRILQIGTAPNKNIERLIPALKGIVCTLVILGKVPETLMNLMSQNGINYEIIDRRLSDDEVFEEYKKCDILAFVSTLEGFGMPIIEANAVGRVVITGNVTSMPEIAGNAAHLVNPLSIEDIQMGLQKIISDDSYRKQLIENGFANCERFNIRNISKQYMELYDSILL